MKKKLYGFLTLLFFVSALSAQVSYEALKLSPASPVAGQKVTFNYNSAITPLNNSSKVDILLYMIKDGNWEVIEPKVNKKEKQYAGSFNIPDGTDAIAISVKNDKKADSNKGKGYLFAVYDPSGKIAPGYYADMYSLYSGMGEYLIGMDNDADAAYNILNEGATANPALLNDRTFLGAMMSANSRKFKVDAAAKNELLLQIFASQPNLGFKDLDFLASSYKRMKMVDKVTSIALKQQTNFPKEVNRAIAQNAFEAEKNADKKVVLFAKYEMAFPFEKDDKTRDRCISAIANAYATEKNYGKFLEWNSKLPAASKASNANNVSWNMAEAGLEMEMAKKMSYEAVTFASKERKLDTSKKPKGLTLADWIKNRANTYAMYADTYSYIAVQTDDYKAAHKYGLDAAKLSNFENKEYNERYVIALAKYKKPAAAMPIIEKMVEQGTSTGKIKENLKTLFVTKNGSEAGYDSYLTNLEKAAKEKRKATLMATMINEPAPTFSLKDTEGKMVSLASLKGKTVLVDFWATWCGPCIASMPGLNMAVAKHKDNKDVQFLFVDTWEQGDNKTKNAVDFMQKKNYPFYVLMDTEDKMVADYKVSGIPTKFIIDKNGNVRFKVIGFDGSTEELAEEIDLMLELASSSK